MLEYFCEKCNKKTEFEDKRKEGCALWTGFACCVFCLAAVLGGGAAGPISGGPTDKLIKCKICHTILNRKVQGKQNVVQKYEKNCDMKK